LIFKIPSLLDSAQNLLQNDRYISHHTLKTLLHYATTLWNRHVSIVGKFWSKHTVKT